MARAPMAVANNQRTFHRELVLNRWALGFFHGGTLGALKARIADHSMEGWDSDGQTRFFHELKRGFFDPNKVTDQELRGYDSNIVAHWQAITVQRNHREGHVLKLKYFQYLSLLFTELYLDRYFNQRQALLDGLNEELARYRSEEGALKLQDFVADDLNKVAFWCATGSGKTLLLHVNIKQYLHYFQNGRAGHYPQKIILLTPNEGLSAQHLQELHLSGFGFAQHFNKTQRPPDGTVEIIDIKKLGDAMGDKVVAVEAFEGNNLVLVDEGHAGAGAAGGAWMTRREALVRDGFAFEYSATFGQAVAKGKTIAEAEDEVRAKQAKYFMAVEFPGKKVTELTASEKRRVNDYKAQYTLTHEDRRSARAMATKEVYAKCILFDYSYKFFYGDGYGKDSFILNMNDKAFAQADNAQKYFTACLLAYYQQLWLWSTHRGKLVDFNIEKPLWVFVGNTVSGEDSDILEVVNFLAFFLNNEKRVKAWLNDLVTDQAQVLDAKGKNIFQNRFTPLMGFSGKADALYADVLQRVFNAPARQRLKLVNLKSSKGELALRVGDAVPFGLINIGDDAGFFRKAEDEKAFDNETDEFGGALFGTINQKDSTLNVLIGSRKFTEGWSSWRVSTMGLLNMGQGEGSQIIQLFGRGVRLKGKGFSLKRSEPQHRPKNVHLDKLETLNIFGVRASYMATFKDYLKQEGVTPSDEILELEFKTRTNLPATQLRTLALKDGYGENQQQGFKRTVFPSLYKEPEAFKGKIKPAHVVLDLYARVEALATQGGSVQKSEVRQPGRLNRKLFAAFDWNRIYLAVLNFKLQRGWSNLQLDMQQLQAFVQESDDWYTLYISGSQLEVRSFADVRKQEDILIRLLCEFTDRFYKTLKTAYEGKFYDVVPMTHDHGSMIKGYQIAIPDTADGHEYQNRLRELQVLVTEGKIGEASQWNASHMVAISFERHLYYPLMSLRDKENVPLKLRPLAFDAPSEWQFVKDLDAFYNSQAGRAVIGPRSLYLLRNAARQEHGLGFALAGNFYPDFLLWLVDDDTDEQWLTFVDPKGIRNIDLNHPKLGLYKEVKFLQEEIRKQAKPGDAKLTLNAFILTPTRFSELLNVGDPDKKSELEDRHVLFMHDGAQAYLTKMFERIA